MAGVKTLGVMLAVVSGLMGILMTENPVQAEALTIGASPSLRPALQEIVPLFEREHGAVIQVVYGPSHTLRRRIEQGAPIDVVLPESMEEVETLEKKGLTLEKPRIYARSSLVLVMSAASLATTISFHDALPNRGSRIALGDPRTSALGQVTARALIKFDPRYRSNATLMYGDHSEDIMNLVETGKADAGIVYRVDAIGSGRMRIVDETPAGKHTTVQFGEALVSTCRETSRDVAEKFLDFMTSPRIQKLLLHYGFDHTMANE